AQMDSLKAGRFCRERGLPVIGAVVNMAGVQCPHCHEEFHLFPDAGIGEALAKLDIDKIAEIPLSPELALGSDRGEPIVTALPDSVVARAFDPMIDAVSALGRAGFHQAVAATMQDVFAENLNDADLKEALAALPAGALGADLSELLNQEASRLKQASQPVKERG
ncbi:Mrp/NBP35 family ATP-binding protein, partial [Salipiger sp. HF18]|uniref:P-loop NTPase n=1 Tax=Salipiger sp. HF18 TaxID=2721557 RepID=UPI00142DAD9A